MREGYWINFRNEKVFPITEHETWIRIPSNAKKLGVPEKVHALASKIKNRDRYLMFLMEHSPIMRVRGHGDTVAFEFNTHDRSDAMDAIWMWGKKNAGPFLWMNIVNFATKENTQIQFSDFESQMSEGGAESVLRVASQTTLFSIDRRIVSDLLEISRQLLNP